MRNEFLAFPSDMEVLSLSEPRTVCRNYGQTVTIIRVAIWREKREIFTGGSAKGNATRENSTDLTFTERTKDRK